MDCDHPVTAPRPCIGPPPLGGLPWCAGTAASRAPGGNGERVARPRQRGGCRLRAGILAARDQGPARRAQRGREARAQPASLRRIAAPSPRPSRPTLGRRQAVPGITTRGTEGASRGCAARPDRGSERFRGPATKHAVDAGAWRPFPPSPRPRFAPSSCRPCRAARCARASPTPARCCFAETAPLQQSRPTLEAWFAPPRNSHGRDKALPISGFAVRAGRPGQRCRTAGGAGGPVPDEEVLADRMDFLGFQELLQRAVVEGLKRRIEAQRQHPRQHAPHPAQILRPARAEAKGRAGGSPLGSGAGAPAFAASRPPSVGWQCTG